MPLQKGKKVVAKQQRSGAAKKAERQATQSQVKKPINRWAAVSPKECASCHQTTHGIDRDCPKNKKEHLVWLKFNTCAKVKGGRNPAGFECTSCFNTRRKYFGEWEFQELNDERSKQTTLDDQFNNCRKDLVSGEKKTGQGFSDVLQRWEQ